MKINCMEMNCFAEKTRTPSQESYLVLVFQLIIGEKPHFLSH